MTPGQLGSGVVTGHKVAADEMIRMSEPLTLKLVN
jgi:hypothetical protein